MARQAEDPEVLAEAYNLMGVSSDVQGQGHQALEYYRKSYNLYESLKDEFQLARVSDNMSTVMFYLGYWDEAFELDKKGLVFWQNIGDRDNKALIEINIGLIYIYRGEWEEAEKYLSSGYETSCTTKNQQNIALAQTNLGLLYLAQGDIERGTKWLNDSLALLTEHKMEGLRQLETYCGLAEAAALAGDGVRTLAQSEIALKLAREGEMRVEESITLRLLGLGYYLTGNLEEAEKYLQQSLDVIEEQGILFETGRTLVELARLLGETDRVKAGTSLINRAIDIFTRLKAGPMLTRAEEILTIFK